MIEFASEKIIFDKMTAMRTWTIFPLYGFCICIVHSWADQLLPQLLMEQFDTLPIHDYQTLKIWLNIKKQLLFGENQKSGNDMQQPMDPLRLWYKYELRKYSH